MGPPTPDDFDASRAAGSSTDSAPSTELLGGGHPVLVHSLPVVLPFHQLTADNFEKLVLELVGRDSDVEHSQQYGVSGQAQGGIDLYCRLREPGPSGRRYRTVQCRNTITAKPSDLLAAVHDFLRGEWAHHSDSFVYATSSGNVRSDRAKAIETAASMLRSAGVRFDVWDEWILSVRLRESPDLVHRYFGPATARQFCGDAA